MSLAKINAIAPWFGSKRSLAPRIVRELGPHTQYFELLCGSMAVLLAKEPSQKETVNDLHGGLVCLARVIADEIYGPTLYERLQRATVCEALLQEADQFMTRCDEVPWRSGDDTAGEAPSPYRVDANMANYAYWYFLASWMTRNGVAGTDRMAYQIAVRWTRSGGSPTIRFRNAVESIPQWHQRLQNVVILRRDAFRIVHKFEDSVGTAIYVDPPYVPASRSGYESGNGESSRYLHEFQHETSLLEADDHERLRDALANYKKARVVISYYDCPRVRELYAGWTFVDCARRKHLTSMHGVGNDEAPEVLILNGPSYTEAAP